jgi:hypothetical protein
MNLSISKEEVKSLLFGAEFKVKAHLSASPEEVQAIVQRSLGDSAMAQIPNYIGQRFAYEPLYVAEILNRDWETKCRTLQDAESVENLIIDACKNLKALMQREESTNSRNIEL